MAYMTNRFGWDNDRGDFKHDAFHKAWMNALQDYPLTEIQNACGQWILEHPNKMPNQGNILEIIRRERKRAYDARPRRRLPEPVRERCSKEEAARIVAAAGYGPKKFGGKKYV